MRHEKILAIFALLVFWAMAGPLAAGSQYQYVSADELALRLKSGEPTFLVDVRVEEEFKKSHIIGAVPTYSYPVETERQRAQLDVILPNLKNSHAPIVLVCPRGGGGQFAPMPT